MPNKPLYVVKKQAVHFLEDQFFLGGDRIINLYQDARKQAGLDVSDRIVLGVSGSDEIEKALAEHRDYVMAETLAVEWEVGQDSPLFSDRRELGELHWIVEFSKK